VNWNSEKKFYSGKANRWMESNSPLSPKGKNYFGKESRPDPVDFEIRIEILIKIGEQLTIQLENRLLLLKILILGSFVRQS